MSVDPAPGVKWWPLSRKIRGVFAAAIAGDFALITAAITTGQWLPCLLGVVTSTGAAITGYMLSDDTP
jgi:hypothetical protein